MLLIIPTKYTKLIPSSAVTNIKGASVGISGDDPDTEKMLLERAGKWSDKLEQLQKFQIAAKLDKISVNGINVS